MVNLFNLISAWPCQFMCCLVHTPAEKKKPTARGRAKKKVDDGKHRTAMLAT